MKLKDYKSVSDRQDAYQLRRILNDELTHEEVTTTWKAIFPDIAIWSIPEIQEWLSNVFLFTPVEVDKLIHKYKTQVHEKVQPNKTMTPLPKFKKNDPNLVKISKNYWEIINMMKEAEKLLNESTSLHYYYDSKENYEHALTEKNNMNNLFLEIRKSVDRHITNCERHLRGEI